MNKLIRQAKCSPICFPSQIAKLNVRQMYHSYGMYYWLIFIIIKMTELNVWFVSI